MLAGAASVALIGADLTTFAKATAVVKVSLTNHVRSAGLQAGQAGAQQAPVAQAALPADAPARAGAVLSKYCITCHNEKRKTAGLMIDKLDLQHVGADAEVWEKIARKFRTHEMPPPGAPRPDAAAYAAVTAHIESALDAAAPERPNVGRVPVHRLNRTEYANAIRDLLGLDIDSRGVLPADDADQEGFDNVASVLTVSPALLENYLSAARMISRLAVGDTSRKPMVDVFKVERDMVQDERMSEDLPFGSRGGTAVTYQFPVDGEYLFKIDLKRQLYDYIVGMGEPHQLDVRLDGVLLKRFTVGGEGKGMTTPENFAGNTPGDPEWEKYMLTADRGLEVRAPVKAGPHVVGVSFVRRLWEDEGVLQPPQTGFGRTTNELYFGYPALKTVSIGGPFNVVGPGESPTRRALFVCTPKSGGAQASVAARGGGPPQAERASGGGSPDFKEEERPVRGRSFPLSRRARIAGRSLRPKRRYYSTFIAPDAPKTTRSTRAFSAASSACWRRRASSSGSVVPNRPT